MNPADPVGTVSLLPLGFAFGVTESLGNLLLTACPYLKVLWPDSLNLHGLESASFSLSINHTGQYNNSTVTGFSALGTDILLWSISST
jgi:hypothetical protein